MDDALLVRGFEGRRRSAARCQTSSSGIGRAASAIGQRRALDELQHERADAVGFLEAVDRGDVRMIQRGEHLRFPPEARQPIVVLRRSPTSTAAP